MKPNLRIFGSVLVAAVVMSAAWVSAASASPWEMRGHAGTTTLTGSQGELDVFTTHGGTVSCHEVTYAGTMSGPSATQAEVAPTYGECTAFGFIHVPVHENGCSYELTAGTEAAGSFEGSVHISCPEGKAIELTAPGCTVTVSTQTPTGGTITFTNKGSGDTREVEVDVALTGVHYIEHNKGVFPTCSFPTETTTDGAYDGTASITGEKAGVHTPIWVGDPPPADAEFRGHGGTTLLTGSQGKLDVLTTHGGAVSCHELAYEGAMVSSSTTEVDVVPTYGKCTAFGFIEVPVHENGCKFKFTVDKEEGGYFEGGLHILCPKEKAIELTAPGCTVSVGSQTPTGGTVTFTTVGAGETREVTIETALTGIHYIEHDKGVFPTCSFPTETTSDGTYNGLALITGERTGAHTPVWVE